MLEFFVPFLSAFILFCGISWFFFARPYKRLSESRRNLKEAKREAEKVAQIPMNNPNPIIQISLNGDILYANPVAYERFMDLEELGLEHPMISGLDDYFVDIKKGRGKKQILSREVNYKGVVYSQTCTSLEVGGRLAFVTYCHDITERKVFEKQLEITRDAAEVASRAKSDFLANMSHELRTPMNGIIGLSEFLMESELNEDSKELAEAVNSSSRNLLILLNDILDLSKIEVGELTLERIAFDIRRTVRQTVDLLKQLASRKGVVLECSISPLVPERIIGDPARFQQILNNLISNSIKFTEIGYVRLDITTKKNSQNEPVLVVRVEDSGIGIPYEKQSSVFQKFTQADVSTARKYGGTGLGLSITKELVEMMSGRISLDSVEGKGTTFCIEVPMEVAPENKRTEDEKDGVSELLIDTKKRLLIVDDHPVNLLFLRKVLKKIGFDNVKEARSGHEALHVFEADNCDLILMDCQMPEMDGFEASEKIRYLEGDKIGGIPIIAVTADAMKGAREKCLDAGMNDYISKPVDVEKLRAILSQWIPGTVEENDMCKPEDEMEAVPIYATVDKASEEGEKLLLDWERLEMFTDGDPEEEKTLIEMFITYAEESLEALQDSLEAQNDENWRSAAHKFKGSAANLGAQILSDLCFDAEKSYTLADEEKCAMLDNIKNAYRDVVDALMQRCESV